MAEILKEIKTKIALKTLSYTEWDAIKETYKPLKGEVCICTIPEGNAEATNAPTVLFKVGDGEHYYKDLKWASALAADVYDWAKSAGENVFAKDGTGNVISGIAYDATLNGGKGGFKYTTASVATSEGLEELQKTVAGISKDIADNRDAWNKYEDTRYSFSTDGDKLVVKKTLYINGVAGTEETVGTYEFLTADEVAETLKGYYTKGEVDAKFVTGLAEGDTNGTIKAIVNGVSGADVKVHGLQDAAYATVASLNETAQGYANAVLGTAGDTETANTVYGAKAAAAKALEDAKKYADEKPHENTAHTHTVGAGLVKTGDGGISGNVEYSANIDVKYDNSKIFLIDKTSGATIGNGFDASEFVKDSYLQNVSYDDANNVLTFTFVDNEDKLQAIPVDLNDLVDVYTADEISLTKSGAQFSIKDGGVSTAKIANDAVTADKLADAINTDIAKGVDAKAVTDTLKGLAFQDKIDNSDIDDNSIAASKITNFATEVAAVKVANAGHADSADEATHATNADNAADAAKLGGQLPSHYATKAEHDALDERTWGYSVDWALDESGQPQIVNPEISISSGESVFIYGGTGVSISTDEYATIDLVGATRITGSLTVGGNSVVTENQLSTIATSGSIYDVTEASETDDGIKYIILDCNW